MEVLQQINVAIFLQQYLFLLNIATTVFVFIVLVWYFLCKFLLTHDFLAALFVEKVFIKIFLFRFVCLYWSFIIATWQTKIDRWRKDKLLYILKKTIMSYGLHKKFKEAKKGFQLEFRKRYLIHRKLAFYENTKKYEKNEKVLKIEEFVWSRYSFLLLFFLFFPSSLLSKINAILKNMPLFSLDPQNSRFYVSISLIQTQKNKIKILMTGKSQREIGLAIAAKLIVITNN